MEIAYIIVYTSMFVYLFPPIRQYGGDFFYFFLVLALADPLTYFIRTTFMVDVSALFIGFSILMYFAVMNFENLKLNRLVFFLILALLSYGANFVNRDLVTFFLFLIHIFIFAAVLRISGEHFMSRKEINLFFVMLLLYELNAIVKFIWVMSADHGVFFFYFTGFLNIPIGIYFALCTVKKPLWKFSIAR